MTHNPYNCTCNNNLPGFTPEEIIRDFIKEHNHGAKLLNANEMAKGIVAQLAKDEIRWIKALMKGGVLIATSEQATEVLKELTKPEAKAHKSRVCPECEGERIVDNFAGKKSAKSISEKGLTYYEYDCPTCQGEVQKANRPEIICLCGSTRFVDTFNEWRQKLTLDGKIVVSIELVLPRSEREDPQHSNYKVKQMLDELHLRKIDLADRVMILNVGGYIGESTRNELNYAKKIGKTITYLEEDNG